MSVQDRIRLAATAAMLPAKRHGDGVRHRYGRGAGIGRDDRISADIDARHIVGSFRTRTGWSAIQQGIGGARMRDRARDDGTCREGRKCRNQQFGSPSGEIKLLMLHRNKAKYFVTCAAKHSIKPTHKKKLRPQSGQVRG
ncbi:MAG TPA: hypothetical protein VHC40_02980 [Rhizomicrobium sp.]|nr:hypothetical protein [Rhizomicrobium sp.]